MTPINLNPLTSPFPLVEPNEDQHFHLFTPPSQGSSSSSSLLFPVLLDPIREQGGSYDRELQKQHQHETDKYVLHGGSTDHLFLPTASLPTVENESGNILKFSICKQGDKEDGSVRWMSSKMRLMRKMINSERIGANKPSKTTQKFQDQPHLSLTFDTNSISNSSSNTTTIRTCSDCNTTKTPLWRSGPRGPKSLCNACGIRQRKARRAMAAAAAAASGTLLTNKTSSMGSKVQHKEKRSGNGNVQEYKKRCKLASPPISRKKICFEDFYISSSENSAFHQVFPQDEKEAAILLMALSCGLVHG